MFLGVPFNIASYSLLVHLVANDCDLKVDEFIHTLGDFHIYHEHFDQIDIQLKRDPRQLPQLQFVPKNIFSYKVGDFELINYDPHPIIKARMNV